MTASFRKLFVVLLLTLTSLFQGWPLLVAASCSMADTTPSVMPENCCCCETKEPAAASVLTTCSPGDELAGVLQTDVSLLSARGKQVEEACPATLTINTSLASGDKSLAEIFLPTHATLRPHKVSPPVFVLDCVFRI